MHAPAAAAGPAVLFPRLTPPEQVRTSGRWLARLNAAALKPTGNRWPASRDIAEARNAHVTNKPGELLAALEGSFDYFEGDVRVRPGGKLVMAHDATDFRGLTLEEWLKVGAASGRGLKLDVKDGAAIIPSLELARRIDIAGTHLVINVSASTSDAVLGRVRSMYPDAWVNLSPGAPYDVAAVRALGQKARTVGGKVQFPMNWALVTPALVQELLPFGRVAIWNDPSKAAPTDIRAERARLRAMGVNGTIDLRART